MSHLHGTEQPIPTGDLAKEASDRPASAEPVSPSTSSLTSLTQQDLQGNPPDLECDGSCLFSRCEGGQKLKYRADWKHTSKDYVICVRPMLRKWLPRIKQSTGKVTSAAQKTSQTAVEYTVTIVTESSFIHLSSSNTIGAILGISCAYVPGRTLPTIRIARINMFRQHIRLNLALPRLDAEKARR
jgi:hypothetical protein